jgi:large subunit ribosomal protein L24
MKLKKGDNVIVIAGKEKGKKGKIVKVLPGLNKVIVEGLNMIKRHQRPKKSNEKGQMVKMAMPIHASNVMIVDPKTEKGSRIGKRLVGGTMVRISKKSNQEI